LAYRRAHSKIDELCDSADLGDKVKIAFLSSFTIEPLVDFAAVESAAEGIILDKYVAGYGQFNQQLLDPSSGLYEFSPEITFLMVEFDSLIDEQEFQQDTGQAAEKVVSQISSLAKAYKDNHSGILAVSTFVAAPRWPFADQGIPCPANRDQEKSRQFRLRR